MNVHGYVSKLQKTQTLYNMLNVYLAVQAREIAW